MPPSLAAMFWRIKFILLIFVESQLVKLFQILTNSFRGDLQSFCYGDKPRLLAAMFFYGSNLLAIFVEGHLWSLVKIGSVA